MLKGIKGLIESKKSLAFIFGCLAVVVCYLALEPGVADKVVPWITYMVLGYLGAQGLADLGKGKIQAEKALPDLPSLPAPLMNMILGQLGAPGAPGPAVPPNDDEPVK